jgi:methionyl-tRNA synthetase
VLDANKAISLGSHTGFYSTNEETFVMEKDLIKEEDQFKT